MPDTRIEIDRVVGTFVKASDVPVVQGAIDCLPDILQPDEVLLALVVGRLERPLSQTVINIGFGDLLPRLIALTDRRLVAIRKRVLRPMDTTSIPLESIKRILGKPGLLQGSIIVRDGNAELMIGGVRKSSISPFVEQTKLAIETFRREQPAGELGGGGRHLPTTAATHDGSSAQPKQQAGGTSVGHEKESSTSDARTDATSTLQDPAVQRHSALLIVPPRRSPGANAVPSQLSTLAYAQPGRQSADSLQDAPEKDARTQTSGPGTFREMSDRERTEVIERLDREYGSRVKRHGPKVAAIPDALRPDELLHFLTDAHLYGTFLLTNDLFAVTDSRLLVIRDNGKRVDAYELSEAISVKAKKPIVEGRISSTPVTFAFTDRELKALIYSTTAAIPFIHIAHRVASYLRNQNGKLFPELDVPYELDRTFTGSDPLAAVIDALRVPPGPLLFASADVGTAGQRILRHTRKRNQKLTGPKLSRAQMIKELIREYGLICAGCDREFDDPAYLELDHVLPRSDGGPDHISNRLLLCGPCNRIKSNRLTLSGLRAENQKRGRMAKPGPSA